MTAAQRKGWIIFGGVVAVVILIWISRAGGLIPQVMILNKYLNEDPVLAEYPYRFRAVLLASGVATLTRPYDQQVPPWRFLATIEPELANKELEDPAYMDALRRLKEQEKQAIRVVMSHPEATAVDWTLDRAWYHKNGIELPPASAP